MGLVGIAPLELEHVLAFGLGMASFRKGCKHNGILPSAGLPMRRAIVVVSLDQSLQHVCNFLSFFLQMAAAEVGPFHVAAPPLLCELRSRSALLGLTRLLVLTSRDAHFCRMDPCIPVQGAYVHGFWQWIRCGLMSCTSSAAIFVHVLAGTVFVTPVPTLPRRRSGHYSLVVDRALAVPACALSDRVAAGRPVRVWHHGLRDSRRLASVLQRARIDASLSAPPFEQILSQPTRPTIILIIEF